MFNFKGKTKNRKDKKMTPALQIEFGIGDTVKVCSEEWKIKELQNCKDCGGYSPLRMQGLLGKCVKVKHMSQYCVRVEWENCEFDLHPNLIETIGQKPLSINRSCEIRDKHAEILFEAIETGDPMLVCEKLLPYLLNTKNCLGRTPINAACVLGHVDVVKILIPFGTDLDIEDNDGNLPVHNCILKNHLDILAFIIECDTKQLNALDRVGRSLLHLAVMKNNEDIAKYLIEKKIDTRVVDASGLTAIQYASDSSNENIRLLFEVTINIPSSSPSLVPSYPTISIPSAENIIYQMPTIECNENYIQAYLDSSLNPVQGLRKDHCFCKKQSMSPFQPSMTSVQVSRSGLDISSIDDQQKQNECIICFSGVKEVAYVPCGHTACRACANRLFECHICKKEIIRKQTIYIS